MKTTLDIPEDLLSEVMQASGSRTKREVVLRALEDFKSRAKLRILAGRLGRSKTFMGFDELMKLREQELPKKPNAGYAPDTFGFWKNIVERVVCLAKGTSYADPAISVP
jgi:Arc/MetJ family transcription regulator